MDFKARALVLRVIPYNDKTNVVKAFTSGQGLSTFLSHKSNKSSGNIIRNGSFLTLLSHQKKGNSIRTIKESIWDHEIPSLSLPHHRLSVWLFTLELLYKCLVENLHIPSLFNKVQTYYISLFDVDVSGSPLIPLIIVKESLGLHDNDGLHISEPDIIASLSIFGILATRVESNYAAEVFTIELEKFCAHFEIKEIETLSLL